MKCPNCKEYEISIIKFYFSFIEKRRCKKCKKYLKFKDYPNWGKIIFAIATVTIAIVLFTQNFISNIFEYDFLKYILPLALLSLLFDMFVKFSNGLETTENICLSNRIKNKLKLKLSKKYMFFNLTMLSLVILNYFLNDRHMFYMLPLISVWICAALFYLIRK